MSEEAPPEPVKRSLVARAAGALPGRTGWGDARARIKDLCVVFFGVYAAFALNRYESDRRDNQRRTQILDALEREVSAKTDDLKQAVDEGQMNLSEFDRRLAANEMPSLGIQYSNASYSPSESATLLQVGGLELLDVQTLELVRKVNLLERSLNAITHDQFEMELTILGTHEGGEFYDAGTRQLKSHYKWYPVVLHNELASAQTLLAAEQELLTRVRDKQHPGKSGGH